MEKQTQRRDLWTRERGGEGEMYGESNMETYITICKIDSQEEFAQIQMSQATQTRGWDEEGDGKEIQEGEDMSTPVADSC